MNIVLFRMNYDIEMWFKNVVITKNLCIMNMIVGNGNPSAPSHNGGGGAQIARHSSVSSHSSSRAQIAQQNAR